MNDIEHTMTMDTPPSPKSLFARIPTYVFLIALLIAVLSISRYWRAQLQTPQDWKFEWNISVSPDYMQYRMWMRQTQDTGVLVENNFTTEPNPPHLLVLFYFVIGKISEFINLSPEVVYAYTGAFLAFIFTIFLYTIVRWFIKTPKHVWWVFGVLLLGGGLGAYLKGLSVIPWVRNNPLFYRIFVVGYESWPVFEDYRGNYIFISLFDTHYILTWLLTAASIIAFYFALKKSSVAGLLITAALFTLTTLVHIYEGVTLSVVATFILLIFWRKKLITRQVLITYAVTIGAVFLGLAIFAFLYRLSDLPASDWRGINILVSTLIIAFPVAWISIAMGIVDYWKNADFDDSFLIGWAAGCLALTLSGPFFPYPDRGTMTLQIPLYLIAGLIYFRRYKRVTWPIVALIVVLIGLTPVWYLREQWNNTTFVTYRPAEFTNADHRAMIEALKDRAQVTDVLITDTAKPAWKSDLLWLAPEYPGKLYCGHFFLTVDYTQKCTDLRDFYGSDLEDQAKFLHEKNIRFIYLEPGKDLSQFEKIPGVDLILRNSAGSLFEYGGSRLISIK
jgi:hypothetical protein